VVKYQLIAKVDGAVVEAWALDGHKEEVAWL
jgi:hypothetical protein